MQYSQITPETFSQHTTDSDRHEWTPDKVWWIIEAAKNFPDTRFIVTTNNQSGRAEGNVTLWDIRQTPGYGTYQVLVRFHDYKGAAWYPLRDIGVIMACAETSSTGVLHTALKIQRTREADNPYFEMCETNRRIFEELRTR